MRSIPINNHNPEYFFGNLIEPDLIRSLHFPKNELLISADELKVRKEDIRYLTAQKNLDKIQFRIHFEDIEGSKLVITTISDITDENVIIRNNLYLPIHRIVRMTVIQNNG